MYYIIDINLQFSYILFIVTGKLLNMAYINSGLVAD